MPTPDIEAVTPGLVLVDPELRERLLQVPHPAVPIDGADTGLAPHGRLIDADTHWYTSPPGADDATPCAPDNPSRPARRSRGSAIAIATLAALFLALPSLAFLPPRQSPELGGTVVTPRATQTVAWQTEALANYYAFELSANGVLVMTASVTVPSIIIGPVAPPGRYVWRVFAGRGAMAAHDWKGPIAGGTLVLG